ncbi:hypothetical protein BJX63DRAFT_434000 [Aspergillus granulosus]|uniref:Uncharacterized protein n=1 Tax=Aspergillus granulosus TaxID=176169 RepID=A0ABR4H5S2_9EURO
MKISLLLSTIIFLVNQATAWHGSMAASGYFDSGDGHGIRQIIYLTDYTTGSTWQTTFYGGFNGCNPNEVDKCAVLSACYALWFRGNQSRRLRLRGLLMAHE